MIGRRFSRKAKVVTTLILVIAIIAGVITLAIMAMQKPEAANQPTQAQEGSQPTTPTLKHEVVISGLKNPWDVAFLPDRSMLVNEREGRLVHKLPGEKEHIMAQIPDVKTEGEGGLMGLEVDREFTKNSFIYTCYASRQNDVRVVRWVLTETGLTGRKDIITGMPFSTSGRHFGCRVKMDAAGVLWVGTGDAAAASNPQDPKSLGGKILRVDREGAPVAGNLAGLFDPRIYSFGHRNTQGIALFDTPRQGVAGFSAEHGTGVDDEVNKLVSGNFGWAPLPPYNESVPMTDKAKFPDAIDAVWSSGQPTIAISGITFLTGPQWKAWDRALAVAVLKDKQLRIQKYDDNFKLTREDVVFRNQFGRIRAVTQGPDGNLYLTTDNGTNDQVIRIIPE